MKQLPEVMSILGTGKKILEYISDSTVIRASISVIYISVMEIQILESDFNLVWYTGHSHILMKYLALDSWVHLDLTAIPFLSRKKSARITSALCRLRSHTQLL